MADENWFLDNLDSQQALLRRCTLPAIILLSALGIALSILCLNVGYTIVFQNVFYLPIILACSTYQKKGMIYTTFVATAYFILISVIPNDPTLIVPAAIRVLFFEIVGGFTVLLSEQKNLAERKLEEHKQAVSETILRETRFLNEELNHCLDRENANNDEKALDELILNAIPAGIVAWDDSGTIIKTNARLATIYGKTEEKLRGSPVDELDAGLRKKDPTATPDSGRIFWTWTPFEIAKGSKKGMIATAVTIPEEKRHE